MITIPNFEDFKPTKAKPGSQEKIDVLSDRIIKGLPLHHPEDYTWGETRTLLGMQCFGEVENEHLEMTL